MTFRVTTLNLERDEKRFSARRELILQQLVELKPDICAFNEVSIPLQMGRWLQQMLEQRLGRPYALMQQSKANAASLVEAEAILARYPVLGTANLDYQTLDIVAQVARLNVDGRKLDAYVTHLYRSRGDDSLRLFQVQQLLAWIQTRNDADAQIVCGDFNAPLDRPSAQLMASHFRPTQTAPTAFTPLADTDGSVSHPYWERFDRCIDYIWVAGPLTVQASGVCFNKPGAHDATLWPSDHVGVWADLVFT